jgi:hypothetical protein
MRSNEFSQQQSCGRFTGFGPGFARWICVSERIHSLMKEPAMRIAMITVLSAALVSPLLTGCGDKEVDSSKTTSTNPLTNNTTTTDKTKMQRPDGTTYTNTNQQTAPAK